MARVVATVTLVATPTIAATIPAGAQDAVWVEPVVAPIVDGYRPPAHIGAAGNRGWEYRTDPGSDVVAAGGGVVVFAGPIAGSNYVSIQHPDGRRTTYSHVETIAVAVGVRVDAGDAIASSGERLHFGVRVGDEYRDPGELFAGGAPPPRTAAGDGLRLVPAPGARALAAPHAREAGVSGAGGAAAAGVRSSNAAVATAWGRWLVSAELPPSPGMLAPGW